jgi:phage terminase large subunit GpA-like protein
MTTASSSNGAGPAFKFLRHAGMDSVSAWAEKTIWFSDRYSPSKPGKVSLDQMPYLREVLDSATAPGIHEVTLCFAVQCGKSTALQLMLAHRLTNRATPCMVVLPSLKLARSISSDRWMELVKGNECLQKLCPDNDDELKLDEQRFRSGTCWWVGAGSESNLSSRSVGMAIADEIDKFPDWNTKEAAPLQLIGARMESFPHWLYVQASTPTIDQGVNIWTEFMRGDQRYFTVACPECHHHFNLEWEGIRWDEKAFSDEVWDFDFLRASTHYECPGCRAKIHPSAKQNMLRNGFWKPTAQGEPGRRSYHLNALYSPHKSWGDLAVMFVMDKESIRGLHHFVNSYLAKPWTPAATTVKPAAIEDVISASPEYLLGECPLAPEGLFCGVDVQQTELFYVIRAFGKNAGKPWSALIDYGQLIGWDAVLQKFEQKYPTRGLAESGMACMGGFVDSGYAARRTGGVYEFVIRAAGKFWASKGRAASAGMRASVVKQVVEHLGRTLPLVQYDDNVFKHTLYINKIKERTGADWWLPRNLGRDYISQLTNERLVERKLRFGQRELTWEVVGPNHLGDCEKLALVFLEHNQSTAPEPKLTN